MSRKTRRTLFVLFCLLFIIAGAIIVFYASGYTIAWSRFSIEKTGAIYLKFSPDGWTSLINNKPVRNTSHLLGGTGAFIKNLSPKTYSITVEEPGFLKWTKDLRVEPGFVTKADQLILIPDPIVPLQLFFPDSIAHFWFLGSGEIIQNEAGALRYAYKGQVFELKGNTFVSPSKDGSRFITAETSKKRSVYYLYAAGDIKSATNISLIFENLASRAASEKSLRTTGAVPLPPSQIRFIVPHPFDQEKWIVADAKRIAIIDMRKLEIITVEQSTSTSALATDSGGLYYADASGVYRFDLILKTTRKLFEGFGKESVLTLDPLKEKALLVQGNSGSLVYINESGNPIRLADKTSVFAASADSRKIAFLDTDGTLNIHFLEDSKGFLRNRAGDVLRISLPEKEKIARIEWYANENYLIVYYPRATRLIELDEQNAFISYDLPSFDGTVIYDRGQNRFFGTRNGSMFEYSLE